LPPDFAYACGSPLNENDQYAIKSTPRHATGIGYVDPLRLKRATSKLTQRARNKSTRC